VLNKIDRLIANPWFFTFCIIQFAAALVIFAYYALTPGVMAGSYPDWLLHFAGNILLFLSARLAFLRVKNLWFVVIFALAYGTSMEIAQHLVPARYFDPRDLLANWAGALTGLMVTLALQWGYRRLMR